LRVPLSGSRVITMGSVMYGPPSPGQVVMMGSLPRSGLVSTTSWQGADDTVRGMAVATRPSFGSMRILSSKPAGGCDLTRSEMARACWSRSSTPSAQDMRRRVA